MYLPAIGLFILPEKNKKTLIFRKIVCHRRVFQSDWDMGSPVAKDKKAPGDIKRCFASW